MDLIVNLVNSSIMGMIIISNLLARTGKEELLQVMCPVPCLPIEPWKSWGIGFVSETKPDSAGTRSDDKEVSCLHCVLVG